MLSREILIAPNHQWKGHDRSGERGTVARENQLNAECALQPSPEDPVRRTAAAMHSPRRPAAGPAAGAPWRRAAYAPGSGAESATKRHPRRRDADRDASNGHAQLRPSASLSSGLSQIMVGRRIDHARSILGVLDVTAIPRGMNGLLPRRGQAAARRRTGSACCW